MSSLTLISVPCHSGVSNTMESVFFFFNLLIILFFIHIYNAASLSRIFCNNGICSNLQILHLDVQVSSTNRIHMINLMIETINFVNVFTQFCGS